MKDEIRKQVKEQRKKLSPQFIADNSAKIVAKLCSNDMVKNALKIGVYAPLPGEVDLTQFFALAQRQHKECYLPVIDSHDKVLTFAKYQIGDKTVLNAYGIMEPVKRNLIIITDLDVVLVPMVAFNSQKYRLGFGGGFYDRTFAYRRDIHNLHVKPYLIGVAFDCQRYAFVSEPWDLALDLVITENVLIR